jgi:hypothetical protein
MVSRKSPPTPKIPKYIMRIPPTNMEELVKINKSAKLYRKFLENDELRINDIYEYLPLFNEYEMNEMLEKNSDELNKMYNQEEHYKNSSNDNERSFSQCLHMRNVGNLKRLLEECLNDDILNFRNEW